MIVTAIRPQKFRKNFFNIHLDGKFAFALNADEIVKSHLKIGSEISDIDVSKFKKVKKDIDLTDSLFRYISFRPRSEKEVRDYFKKKKIDLKEIEKLIDKAKSLKLINDADFAVWWLEQRAVFRPKGLRLLKIELKQKGISDEIINSVLSNKSSQSEYKIAINLAQKKLPSLKNYDPEEKKQKLFAFLVRRGFDFDEAETAVDATLKKD